MGEDAGAYLSGPGGFNDHAARGRGRRLMGGVARRLQAMIPRNVDPLHNREHHTPMQRTTIMAEPETLERLRALARERGVSFAEVAREALQAKAAEYRPRPSCFGIGSSGRRDVSERAGVGRTPPR